MKALLFVYAILIGAFFLYIYNFQTQSFPSVFNEKGDEIQSESDINERYVIVTFQVGMDYWKEVLKGAEDAAESLNVAVEYRGATQYDVNEQITVLEQVIATKPAGIAISAIHPENLNVTINKAVDSGIPVVLFDSDAPESEAYSFLGTNNYQAGVTAAHKMAELLNQKGKVAIVTLPNQSNHMDRSKGFQETIKKEYPGIEVVAIKDGKGDQLVSKQVALDTIVKHYDLKGIFATEANGGVGLGEAVRSLNKDKTIQIVSFDTDKETLDMVKDGTISATLAQGTWNMGYWSLQYLVHLNHDVKDSKFITYMDTDTGTSVVTKTNIDEFYAR